MNTISADRILLRSVPLETDEGRDPLRGVYFLIRQDKIVYVGQSENIQERIKRHKINGKKFDSYSYILCLKDEINDLEKFYIDACNPELNRKMGRRMPGDVVILGKNELVRLAIHPETKDEFDSILSMLRESAQPHERVGMTHDWLLRETMECFRAVRQPKESDPK